MKTKIFVLTILMVTMVSFGFTNMDSDLTKFEEITMDSECFERFEAGSFEQSEHMKTTSDEGIWVKRYKIWPLTDASSDIVAMTNVINNN